MKVRQIRIEGEVAFVPLTKGYEAVIDAADVPLVAGYNWRAMPDVRPDGTIRAVYAARGGGRSNKQPFTLMHREISGALKSIQVDHRDSDGLNNRRANLRWASGSQNSANRRLGRRNRSGHKGVHWNEQCQKWHAQIGIGGRKVYLGLFETVDEAAAAYAAACVAVHGEFGRPA